MIAFVDGTVEYIDENTAVISAGGIGYRIFMTPVALSSVKVGDEVRVHTYLRVAEDLFNLYGFLNREELESFKMLLSVSGAGPKAAMAVLSALSPAALVMSVVSGDYKSITKAQGVGPKLAQKIVLELKDKFKGKEISLGNVATDGVIQTVGGNDAIDALVVLGYSRSEAITAVAKAPKDLSTEDTIKAALIQLMKQ